MTRRLEGWKVGLCVGLGVFLSNIPTVQLAAQIGHDPSGSPYREILLHPAIGVAVGHLSGDRGRVDAGVSNAQTIALRYELPSGRSMLFQFNIAYLMGDRFILNPFADSSSSQRKTGPYPSDLILTEIGLHLRLTGSKTWHRFGPYAGIGLGVLFDVHSPGDTTGNGGNAGSGYKFGTKVGLSASTGVRWYPRRRRLFINAEARGQLWRLKYPASFHGALSPDGSRILPLTAAVTDWTFHPWMSVGLGWTF